MSFDGGFSCIQKNTAPKKAEAVYPRIRAVLKRAPEGTRTPDTGS